MNDFVDNSDEGYDILYADDDTSSVADKNVDTLETKLQKKAELRAAWLVNKEFTLNVCGQTITESSDEKLLGIVISNNLTWNTHL